MISQYYHRQQLIHVLHMAYSGEKAAGYAYNGHWKSLRDPEQRRQLQRIENEEWEHREIVGAMLSSLSAAPQPWRELMMAAIGRSVALGCFLGGWFLPMYFAGRLEHANVNEYNVAAEHAEQLGLNDFASELRRLSDVELTHEEFFYNTIQGHFLLPLAGRLFKWGLPEISVKGSDETPSAVTRKIQNTALTVAINQNAPKQARSISAILSAPLVIVKCTGRHLKQYLNNALHTKQAGVPQQQQSVHLEDARSPICRS